MVSCSEAPSACGRWGNDEVDAVDAVRLAVFLGLWLQGREDSISQRPALDISAF